MKIVVLVKQTFDTEAKIVLDKDGKISADGVKKIMNPYDEFAVEEAVRIKEAQGGEVTVVSLGSADAVDALRLALSMGCDKAVLVSDAALADGDPYSAAQILAAAVRPLEFDLLLAGWVAIDDGAAQTAVRVAEILDLPQAIMATKLTFADGKACGEKEMEGDMVKVETPLPALVTVQKGINEPRYPNMKGIMAAKKKKITTVAAADLGLPADAGVAKTAVREIFLPERRKSCKMIGAETAAEAASQLAEILRNEIKIV